VSLLTLDFADCRPPGFRPPFFPPPGLSPLAPGSASPAPPYPPPQFMPQGGLPPQPPSATSVPASLPPVNGAAVQPPKDGVMWSDLDTLPVSHSRCLEDTWLMYRRRREHYSLDIDTLRLGSMGMTRIRKSAKPQKISCNLYSLVRWAKVYGDSGCQMHHHVHGRWVHHFMSSLVHSSTVWYNSLTSRRWICSLVSV
jgi:hypothetical protein